MLFTTCLMMFGCTLAAMVMRWALQEEKIDPFAI